MGAGPLAEGRLETDPPCLGRPVPRPRAARPLSLRCLAAHCEPVPVTHPPPRDSHP